MMKRTLWCAALVIPLLAACNKPAPKAQDDVEKKVQALLAQMTIDEKIGQMMQIPLGGPDAEEALKTALRNGEIGSMLNVIGAVNVNKLQKIAVEESRLGIPLLIGRDVIHGYRTIFPIPLGMAASWNEELVRQSAEIAAREAASDGIRWTFAPMVDVSRDPRWGRIAESGGEDPLLNAMVAHAMVKGFQGPDMSQPDRIAACVKHYVGYGAAEGGRDYNTTIIPDIYMHNVYLPPFKEAVKAGAATFMSAFNDINGVPASGNEYTIRQVLKNTYGFNGFVVSDWASIQEMIEHGYAADKREAAKLGIKAGVDMEMASRTYVENLKDLLDKGEVPMEYVDDAVARILRIKFKLGLFDNPYTQEDLSAKTLASPEHMAVAHQLAIESVVMLKNEDNLLPLQPNTPIALIGPLAHEAYEQLGTWVFDGKAENSITVLDAFNQTNGAANTFFAKGMEYSRDPSTKGFAEAEKAIAKAKVVVMVMGEESILSGEAKCLAELKFPGKQDELLKLAASKGKPIVLVVMAGRPTGLYKTEHLANTVLWAWHPGSMAGPALADLIFGKAAPSGRLPVTFPKGEGQVPIYYAHKNSGRPASAATWNHIDSIPVHAVQHSTGNTNHTLDYGYLPLYPFGYGLTYTTFEYSQTELSTAEMAMTETLEASVTVTNTGKVAAKETVQCYIRDVAAKYTRPVRELVAYKQIKLQPGESQKVTFGLGAEQLGSYYPDGSFVTEKGEFHVWISPNASEGQAAKFTLK